MAKEVRESQRILPMSWCDVRSQPSSKALKMALEDTSIKRRDRPEGRGAAPTLRLFLSAMTDNRRSKSTITEDVSSLAKAVDALQDAKSEGLLDESDVEAIIEFIATRFVERRVGGLFDKFLDDGSRSWFATSIRSFDE